MEKALLLPQRVPFPDKWGQWDRIYVGHEFCELLIPEEGDLLKILEGIDPALPMTLVTPYVTEKGLAKIEILVKRFLHESGGPFDEVVFNDWGVFRMLKQYGGKRVLGRLLVRQLRDPRIIAIKGRDPEAVPGLEDLSINDAFLQFLQEQGIEHIELDTVPENLQRLQERVRISLYRPFTYVTTTRMCPVANLATRRLGVSLVPERCGFECMENTFSLEDKLMGRTLFLSGNTIFFRNPATEDTTSFQGPDRIVHQELPFCPGKG